MTISYDPKQEMYCIGISQPETATYIHTNDIAEAREEFINRMTWLFNEAVNQQLKDYF